MVKTLLRTLAKWLLKLLYRVEVHGLENFHKAGPRVLIVANHLSFLDAALLGLFLPEMPLFAMNLAQSRKWFFRPFLWFTKIFPIDPLNPMAAKALIKALQSNQKLMIFPEGRISLTGSLMKIYEGPGMIADKAEALILPIYIEGTQYTLFSRIRGKVPLHLFPKIRLTLFPPCHFKIPDTLKGRARRHQARAQLYDLMSEMFFATAPLDKTLFQELIARMHLYGRHTLIVQDIQKQLSYGKLIAGAFVLSRKFQERCSPAESGKSAGRIPPIGLLLPNGCAALLAFLAIQALGRSAAFLNFSMGIPPLLSACVTAQIGQIYTARAFIEKARLSPLLDALMAQGIDVFFLEDLNVTSWDRIRGLFQSFFPSRSFRSMAGTHSAEEDALILFTSGSEGLPKGVVLSHKNLQANCYQLMARVDIGPTDNAFNALPLFHSFGFTIGALLPLLAGVKVFLYPSPLHYRRIPELIYTYSCTLLFGTDTFLAGYARCADPYDFYRLRYVFAGGEKLKEETRRLWADKYGVRVFEGYGTTETAPVISTNTPMCCKVGSVGRLLPGITARCVPVPGIEEGGRLLVKGPNVMKGYLRAETPNHLCPPPSGEYDTGDIALLDSEGYLTIKGRLKRFAKIGGEMLSLAAVETILTQFWPEHRHAIIALPDSKKGEKVILLTEHPAPTRSALTRYAQQEGISSLFIPARIYSCAELPLLPTGKIDYVKVQNLACQKEEERDKRQKQKEEKQS